MGTRNVSAPLEGKLQTAQRAEVQAVLSALAMAQTKVWLITDSKYVCDRLNDGAPYW
jgi:ribonuclease HI